MATAKTYSYNILTYNTFSLKLWKCSNIKCIDQYDGVGQGCGPFDHQVFHHKETFDHRLIRCPIYSQLAAYQH